MNALSPTITARALLTLALITFALITFALLACPVPARAQDVIPPGPSSRGALLIHGNFCGPGNRGPGYKPVDALDLACAHHDACSTDPTSGVLTACACHRKLWVEAGAVARDPHTPPQTREMAQFISDFATALPCLSGVP